MQSLYGLEFEHHFGNEFFVRLVGDLDGLCNESTENKEIFSYNFHKLTKDVTNYYYYYRLLTSVSRLSFLNSSSDSNFDFCSGTTRGIFKKYLGFGGSYIPIESYGIIPANASFIILIFVFLISLTQEKNHLFPIFLNILLQSLAITEFTCFFHKNLTFFQISNYE